MLVCFRNQDDETHDSGLALGDLGSTVYGTATDVWVTNLRPADNQEVEHGRQLFLRPNFVL